MEKLFSKKLLVILPLLFLIFISVPNFAFSQTQTWFCVPEGNVDSSLCAAATTREECEAVGTPGDCIWTEGEAEETSTFCPGAHFWDVGKWLKCILEFVGSLLVKGPLFIIALMGLILSFVTGFLLYFFQSLAGLLIFYSLKATSDISKLGFADLIDEVRELAILFLFLYLAIIGLATILRVHEYEFRKNLVPLIVVALLINFTTPIVQLVVDVGNSLTSSILGWGDIVVKSPEGAVKFQIVSVGDVLAPAENMLQRFGTMALLDGNFFGNFKVNMGTLIGYSATGYVTSLLFLIFLIVIFTYGLVYFMRIIYIWLLAIIAPIAFVNAVFKTKETKAIFVGPLGWDKWWASLLEWSFMGVGLAFWLALAMKLKDTSIMVGALGNFEYLEPGEFSAPSNTITGVVGNTAGFTSLGDSVGIVFTYLAPLIALFLGISSAPGMMGEIAGKFADRAKRFVTGVAARTATSVGAGAIAGIKKLPGSMAGSMAGGAKVGWKKGKEFGGKFLGSEGGALGGIVGGLGGAMLGFGKGVGGTWARAGRRGVGKGFEEMVKPIPEEIREEITLPPSVRKLFRDTKEGAEKFIEEVYKKEGPKGVERAVTSKLSAGVTKKAGLDKLLAENKVSEELVGNREGQKIMSLAYEQAKKFGDKAKMGKLERMTILTQGAEPGKTMLGKTPEEIIKSVKTAGDVKDLAKGWERDPGAIAEAVNSWGGPQLGAAAEVFGKDFTEQYTIRAEAVGIENLMDINPRAALYLAGNAAQDLGLKSPTGLGREDIRKRIRINRLLQREPELSILYNYRRARIGYEKEREKFMSAKSMVERAGETAPPDIINAIANLQQEINKMEVAAARYQVANIESVPARKSKWEEIERLMPLPEGGQPPRAARPSPPMPTPPPPPPPPPPPKPVPGAPGVT